MKLVPNHTVQFVEVYVRLNFLRVKFYLLILFPPECSACPRNLQHVLDGVIAEFVNATREVTKLQHFTQVGDFFDLTTSRLEVAEVRNIWICMQYK